MKERGKKEKGKRKRKRKEGRKEREERKREERWRKRVSHCFPYHPDLRVHYCIEGSNGITQPIPSLCIQIKFY